MRTGLLSNRTRPLEPESDDSQAARRTPSISQSDVTGVPRYSQSELPSTNYAEVSHTLTEERETINDQIGIGQSDEIPEQPAEATQEPDSGAEENSEAEAEDQAEESATDREQQDENAPQEGTEEEATTEEEEQEEPEEQEGEGGEVTIGPGGGSGGGESGKEEGSPIMPLVAAIPRMARIQTPYVPAPPLAAIQRRDEIIQRTGSPPELHHAKVRQAAETVTQAARDAQRQMIVRVGYLARDTRISIEDMADEVWKATRSAIGHINSTIDQAITRIGDYAEAEIDHVKTSHVVEGENVQQVRDRTVLQIYNQLKENSSKIRDAERIADARYEAKVPTAEGFIRTVPEQGRVGRLATTNAEGEFADSASSDETGTMVEAASQDPQADFHVIDEAKNFVDGFLITKSNALAGDYANISRYLLARSRPHLEGHADQQQTQLVQASQQSAERIIEPASKAQFMTMVLGLTIPVSEHHDQDQTGAMDAETHRNDEELAALNRADAQAVFTLRQKRNMATQYTNLDLRQNLTGNLRKQGRNARNGLRIQAKQAEIGLNSSTALMAEDYVDLIQRLDKLLEPGKFLNAQQLVPQILMARESLVRMLATHELASMTQAEGTLDSITKIKKKQLEALEKGLAGAVKSVDQILVRARFDMSMFSSMVTGSMSAGAIAGMGEARTFAEEMTNGILSTNEAVRGRAMDQIDNIAANFFNSSIAGTEQTQFNALKNFVERMEGRSEGSDREGGPLSRVMLNARDTLERNADTLHRITRGPDPAVVGGGLALTYAVPVVGAIATGVYLYQSDPDDNEVVRILGNIVWPGVPAVGDMFRKRGHGNLRTRISNKITEPQRTTALGLFSEHAAVRGWSRAYGIENSTGWFDLSREARESLGDGMSAEEHSALQHFAPQRLASAQRTITQDLEGHERDIALAHLENNHQRAIAAKTLDALAKGRRDSSWGWLFSAEAAQQRSDRARVDAITNMDALLRQHQERHNSFVADSALSTSRDRMFQEVASLTDRQGRSADKFTAAQGRQALITEATRGHYAVTLGIGFNPLMPLTGVGLTTNIERVETSDQAEQFIRDAVTHGADSDQAKASRAAFELTQAEGQSMFGLGLVNELPESSQTYLTNAFENRTLSGLKQQLDDLDREIADTADPDRREDLMRRRRGLQSAFNEEQTKHRQRMLMIMQRIDPAQARDLTPEQAEQEVARRVGDVFARRDSIFTTPRGYSHATYGQEMVTQGRASLQAGAALATEGWGTHESLLLHSYQGRSQAELEAARGWWSENYQEDMDVAMGIKEREWDTSDYLMFGLSPALWFANRGAETSGDLSMQLERLTEGEPKTDLDFMRNANLRHNQDRVRGTGLIASVTMEGTNAQRNLDGDRERMARLIVEEAERRQPGSASQYLSNPTAIFRADGSLEPSIQALTFRNGNFLGDRTVFAGAARSVHNSAEAYQAEIAFQESILTTTIALVALVVTVAAMLIPGVNAVAAGIAVAIISGIATMAVKAGMRGERYGWEEAATDVAMTAIEAGSAGLGGALGKVSAFGRLGRVGSAFAREAISGAVSGGAQIAIQDETWKDGFGRGLENIANSAIKQAAIQGVSAGLSEGISARLTKAVSGNLDAGDISRVQRAASRMGPHTSSAVTEAVSEFFGTAAGESVGLAIDHARGKFKGNFGDVLKHVGMSALRDMAVGGLRGTVNSINKQRYQQLLQSARESGTVTDGQLRAIRLAGISAGELQYGQDISHVRHEVEAGRTALSHLPAGLREQARGLDTESINTLLRVIESGGFRNDKDRNQFVLKAFESIPGFDSRKFNDAIQAAAASRQQAKTREGPATEVAAGIRTRLGEGLDPSLRAAMESVPVDGLQHLSPEQLRQVAEMVARGELDPAIADGLFRHAKGVDPELDESTFLGNLHRAITTAEQAKAFDRAVKQRAHEEVMAAVPEADRMTLAGMPDEGILAFKKMLDQRDAGTPQARESLYHLARANNPELSRTQFGHIIDAGIAHAQQAHKIAKASARTERERHLSFVPEAQRHLISVLPEHALIELRIQQQQGDSLSPAVQRQLIDAALKENPDIDSAALAAAMKRVVAQQTASVAPEQMAMLRKQLESGLPLEQRGLTAEVPILVMRNTEFEAFTRSQTGQAVTMLLHGRPVVVIREGADPAILREEGIHILQSQDPTWADRVGMLDESLLADWDQLPLAQQIALYQNKLDVEIDAQRRLIASIEGDLAKTTDPAERVQLNNRLALTQAAQANLMRRFTEVKSISGIRMMAIASGAVDKPQWLDQPARLFNKDKNKPTDTEPIHEEPGHMSREFILEYLTDGIKPADADDLKARVDDLATEDLRVVADLSASSEQMRKIIAHLSGSDEPAARLGEVAQTLSKMERKQASDILHQLSGYQRRATFDKYVDGLVRLGELPVSDADFTKLLAICMGAGANTKQIDSKNFQLVMELVLPKDASTPAKLDAAEISRLIETTQGNDVSVARKILQAANESKDAGSVLNDLENIRRAMEPNMVRDLLTFITVNRGIADVNHIIHNLGLLRDNAPVDKTFHNLFEMLVLTSSNKLKMLESLVDLTTRLDPQARKAFSEFIERTDQRRHPEVIELLSYLHDAEFKRIQADLLPGHEGRLLSLFVEMMATQSNWALFGTQALGFFKSLHELHSSYDLRSIEIEQDDKKKTINGIETILDYITRTKDNASLSDADRAEAIAQLAADISAASKSLIRKTDSEGSFYPKSHSERVAALQRQIRNLAGSEGVLAGKDAWRAHLDNERFTWDKMETDPESKHFYELLKAAKPQWNNDSDKGQLGAMKQLQPWFEQLARLKGLDPRSNDKSVQKELTELLKTFTDPVRDLKKRDRFDALSRTLREATVEVSLKNDPLAADKRHEMRKEILSRAGLTDDNIATTRPHDADVVSKHIEALVEQIQKYEEMVRLAGDIGASSAGLKQNITEAIGEIELTLHMLDKHSDMLLAMPFGKGTGFDQVWIKTDDGTLDGRITEVVIGEAKGPEASLGNPGKGAQMSLTWVVNTLREMAASGNSDTRKLARRLIEATSLNNNGVSTKYRGIVVQAQETPGSDPKTYTPKDISTPSTGKNGYDFTGIELPDPTKINTG